MSVLESTIEKYLVGMVEAAGGQCPKWTGRKDCPDRMLFLNGYRIPVEVKSPTGSLSDGQVRYHRKLALTGILVEVVTCKDDVDELMNALLAMEECECAYCQSMRKYN